MSQVVEAERLVEVRGRGKCLAVDVVISISTFDVHAPFESSNVSVNYLNYFYIIEYFAR